MRLSSVKQGVHSVIIDQRYNLCLFIKRENNIFYNFRVLKTGTGQYGQHRDAAAG